MGQQIGRSEQEAEAKRLASGIAFGVHGARVLARRGYPLLARQFRQTARQQIAALRALSLTPNEGR